jgi:hypothetical protein
MSLSVNEIEMEILTLSEQEQLKLIDFMESLKIKFPKKSVNSEKSNTLRKIGLFKGQIKMRDDFNDPLPDSFWLEGNL